MLEQSPIAMGASEQWWLPQSCLPSVRLALDLLLAIVGWCCSGHCQRNCASLYCRMFSCSSAGKARIAATTGDRRWDFRCPPVRLLYRCFSRVSRGPIFVWSCGLALDVLDGCSSGYPLWNGSFNDS